MRITFLGTGTSRGIPVVGCDCSVCNSRDPRNRRLRCSLLIESEATVVIDTSADFREQMLRSRVNRLDAIVYTHHHMDHVLGLDDVFPYSVRSDEALPFYASEQTLAELKITFRHLFNSNPGRRVARLLPHIIKGPFSIKNLEFEPIEVYHGEMPVFGFRIADFAYVTDVNRIPPESLSRLRGLDCLVLDGLQFKSHRTHFSIGEALEVIEELAPKRAFLVHMSHAVDHSTANAGFPRGVELAYDGLQLEF